MHLVKKTNCIRRLHPAEFLLSCSFGFSLTLSRAHFLCPRFSPPFFALRFPQPFLAQNDGFPASSLDREHGKALLSGSLGERCHEDLFSIVRCSACHIHSGHCARWNTNARPCGRWFIRRRSAPPREGRKKNMCGFCRLHLGREKWSWDWGWGAEPSEFWAISRAGPSQERTHSGCVWQWHLKKNHFESCAWSFNCCGHGPSPLPKSNVNGLRKPAFFPPPLLPDCMSDSHFTVFTNYENSGQLIMKILRSRRRSNSWSGLRQRTDCKVLEKWAARSPRLPVTFGISEYCYVNQKSKKERNQ